MGRPRPRPGVPPCTSMIISPSRRCNSWPKRSPASGLWLRYQAVILATQGRSANADRPGPGLQPGRPELGHPLQPSRPRRPPGAAPLRTPAPLDRPGARPLPATASRPVPRPRTHLHLLRTRLATHPRASSVSPWACRRCMTCCIATASPASCPGPSTRTPTRSCRRSSRRSSPTRSRPSPRPTPGEKVEVFFEDEARLGQQGTLGPGLGPQGVAAPRRAADPVRLSLRADGGLRRHRGRLGPDLADAERGRGQHVPGAVRAGAARRGPCGAGVGRGGLPHQRRPGGAGRMSA